VAAARASLITAAHLAAGVITLALSEFLDPYPDVTIQVAMLGGAIALVWEQIALVAEEAGRPSPEARLKRIYLDTRQDQISFLDGHVRAFAHFDGAPARVAYDNLRAAVVRILVGGARTLTPRFAALASHYLLEAASRRPTSSSRLSRRAR
jgi:hypothetical protein